jgi:hypothetical protein
MNLDILRLVFCCWLCGHELAHETYWRMSRWRRWLYR